MRDNNNNNQFFIFNPKLDLIQLLSILMKSILLNITFFKQYLGPSSLVAQLVKKPPAMRETWI